MLVQDNDREDVARFLESHYFSVERIPENKGQERKADLRVSKDGNVTVIEVKTKKENTTAVKVITNLSVKEVKIHSSRVHRSKGIYDIVKDAAEQLAVTAKNEELRCLWFRDNEEPSLGDAHKKMIGVLLGIRTAIVDRNGESLALDCYFASNAAFQQFPSIDTVVIERMGQGGMMIPNPLSSRAGMVPLSPLAKFFEERRALLDIYRMEKEGRAYILDSDIDRNDQDALVARLKAKYPNDKVAFILDFKKTTAIGLESRK